ncbi:hypothetical protein FHX57_003849 [Paraburkholderia tropica]|uniref:hypothetical protein n=1 Tax=Paraburkholderia tropica TaxID=92647 RepID=UPI0017C92012|nr:hypothetical protein [Paraburkholderia tropica]MBB6322807.1 hypothetical protein [Paraburkholderia tropica]
MPPQSIVSGASIISFNPFRERTLERFAAPQNLIEMATFGSTPISTGLDRHWLRVSDHDWLHLYQYAIFRGPVGPTAESNG